MIFQDRCDIDSAGHSARMACPLNYAALFQQKNIPYAEVGLAISQGCLEVHRLTLVGTVGLEPTPTHLQVRPMTAVRIIV